MPTYYISIGPPTPLANGVVYALPARACYISFTGTAPQVGNDGSTFAAIPASGVVAAGFIKSAGSDTIVTLKGM